MAASRHPDLPPSHPGELLSDIVIPAAGRPVTQIASLLGIPGHMLDDIMAERAPVTPEIAVRLGKLFGNGARLWLSMQSAHDLWHAERNVDVSKVPTLEQV